MKRGIRHFTQLVAPHLFRPGYHVRRAPGTPSRAWAQRRPDLGVGKAQIAFDPKTVESKTITHELGHTLEYQNRDLFEEAAGFLTSHTKGSPQQLLEGAHSGFKYGSDEFYRPGLSEKREAWRYASKLEPASELDDPSIGPYKVGATELISSGLEWLEDDPETLFVEVPAFTDFLLRRIVLRPKD